MITLGAKWRVRGSVATAAGWVLIVLGIITAFAALDQGSTSLNTTESTWIPESPWVPVLAFALTGLAALALGGGIFLALFARSERDREDDLRLDPLRYSPVRHPARRALPWAVVAMVVVLPSFWAVPLAHPFRAELPVEACTPYFVSQTGIQVSLPSGAVLVYAWSSSDGDPVSVVWAPSGPPVSPVSGEFGDAFLNSSSGYSLVQSNGTGIPFWACEMTSSGAGGNRSIVLTGTYYLPLL